MKTAARAALVLAVMSAGLNAPIAAAAERGLHEVTGVERGDMLKMRSGPGTGYDIVLGLPNGTVVRVHACDQTGGTRWCRVSLRQSRALTGYVSAAYLRGL